MDFSALEIADPATGRTAKSAAVRAASGPALWDLPALAPAFEPSGFNGQDADRMTLCLRVPDEILPQIKALDEWFLAYATEHSERLFNRKMSLEQIQGCYTSPLKVHERYGASLRVKYTASGAQATRFWTPDKTRRTAPEAWRECVVTSRVQIRSVWYLGPGFGLTLTLNDAKVDERVVESPW
jgi:hypothetical protein